MTAFRQESAARAVDMTVAVLRLVGHVVFQRRDQMQIVLRARHRDIQQTPLFLDLIRPARREF